MMADFAKNLKLKLEVKKGEFSMLRGCIIAILSLLLCITIAAKDTVKKKLIKWNPIISAPVNFPAFGQWLYVRYGMDSAVTPYLGGTELLCGGITRKYPATKTISFYSPTGIDLVWASWTERKWYVANIKFSKKEKAIIKKALLSTFPSYDNFDDYLNPSAKKGSYETFHVCCFPGGKIRYFLEDEDGNRIIALDIISQAEETHQLDQSFLHGGRGMIARSEEKYWDSMDEYFDDMLHEGKHYLDLDSIEETYGEDWRARTEYYRKNGRPDPALWDSYFKRYNYRVSVVMENPKDKLWQETCYFTNAEMYSRHPFVNPDNVISNPSALKNISLEWDANSFAYCSEIYFNEEETFRIYKEAFGKEDGSKGELKIVIGKDSASIRTFLTVGKNSYEFKKNQYFIERCKEHGLVGKIICQNYKEPHQEFAGR